MSRSALCARCQAHAPQTVKYFKGLNAAHAALPQAHRKSVGVHSGLIYDDSRGNLAALDKLDN